MDWVILGWYVVTLFAMLASCWMLAAACFQIGTGAMGVPY